MKLVLFLMSLALLLAAGATVDAQEARPRAYVQGSLVLSSQLEGEVYAPGRTRPPLGGTALGAATTAGYFITPALALEGEVLFAGGISTAQVFSYNNTHDEFTSEFSVVSVNGLLRWKPGGTSPVELVVGGGLASARYSTRDGVHTDLFPPVTQTPIPDAASTEMVPNLTGGADVVFPTGSKVAFVGSLRARWRRGAGLDDDMGVSRFALDMGVGLRVRF